MDEQSITTIAVTFSPNELRDYYVYPLEMDILNDEENISMIKHHLYNEVESAFSSAYVYRASEGGDELIKIKSIQYIITDDCSIHGIYTLYDTINYDELEVFVDYITYITYSANCRFSQYGMNIQFKNKNISGYNSCFIYNILNVYYGNANILDNIKFDDFSSIFKKQPNSYNIFWTPDKCYRNCCSLYFYGN